MSYLCVAPACWSCGTATSCTVAICKWGVTSSAADTTTASIVSIVRGWRGGSSSIQPPYFGGRGVCAVVVSSVPTVMASYILCAVPACFSWVISPHIFLRNTQGNCFRERLGKRATVYNPRVSQMCKNVNKQSVSSALCSPAAGTVVPV
jgi:hypothetical protein